MPQPTWATVPCSSCVSVSFNEAKRTPALSPGIEGCVYTSHHGAIMMKLKRGCYCKSRGPPVTNFQWLAEAVCSVSPQSQRVSPTRLLAFFPKLQLRSLLPPLEELKKLERKNDSTKTRWEDAELNAICWSQRAEPWWKHIIHQY